MANLIGIRGIINAGKTTTCGFIYEDLLSIVQTAHSFNNVDVNAYSLRYTQHHTVIDFEAMLTLPNGKCIGLISEGDNLDLRAKLENHIAKGAHAIICCTRSRNRRNSTFRMIQDEFQPNHPIVLEQRVVRSQNTNLRQAKSGVVNAVVNHIRRLL